MSRLSRAARGDFGGAHGGLFLHSMPGHLVRRLQQTAVRLFMEGVTGELTPVQFAALCAIDDQPGIGQTALAALIGYDRATIGGVIDRLEQKHLVARLPSAQDRRSNVLKLTESGRKMTATARPQVNAVQQKLLAPLNAAEQAQFAAICLKLLAHHGG